MNTRGFPGMFAPRYQECFAIGSTVLLAASLTPATHLSIESGRASIRSRAFSRMCLIQSANQVRMLLNRHRHVAQHRRAARAGDREQVRKPCDLETKVIARARLPHIL